MKRVRRCGPFFFEVNMEAKEKMKSKETELKVEMEKRIALYVKKLNEKRREKDA